MRNVVRGRAIGVGLSTLVALSLTVPASAQLLPGNQSFGGAAQNQWAERWYQWIMPLPVGPGPEANRAANSTNPGVETNGSQSSNGIGVFPGVTFLSGSFASLNGASTVVRNAFVPIGHTLFFPIINGAVDNTVPTGQTPTNFTANQLQNDYPIGLPVNMSNFNTFANATNLTLTIDGVPQALGAGHRQTNNGFNITYTGADNITEAFGYDSTLGTGVHPSSVLTVADGYWAAIGPLAPGNHTIRFTGTATYYGADGQVLDFDPGTDGVQSFSFSQDITYNLSVGAPEPGTVALIAPMLVGLFWGYRRRR